MTVKQIVAGSLIGVSIVSVMLLRMRKGQDGTSLSPATLANHKPAPKSQTVTKQAFILKKQKPKDAPNAGFSEPRLA